MSTTFVVALILAIIVLANLRLFLLIASAVVLALVVTGVGTISGALADDTPPTSVVAPARPGPEPGPAQQSDDRPQPPR